MTETSSMKAMTWRGGNNFTSDQLEIPQVIDKTCLIEIDTAGNLHDYESPTATDRMLLHLPTITSHRALPITLPLELSEAQNATYGLLIKRAHQINKDNKES